MHLHFALLLYFIALAQAKVVSCDSFWSKKGPTFPSHTVQGQCTYFPGYPKTFGSTKVTVVYTPTWLKLAGDTTLAAPVLQDGLSESIDYYSKFTKLPPHIVVILTGMSGTTIMDTWYPLEKKSPCQVRAYKEWTTDTFKVPSDAKQAIAHELYHCVQGYSSLGNNLGGGSAWVMDGSANYFSNLVYPDNNMEWWFDYAYEPTKPIYSQNKPYSTEIFFQALEESMGPTQMNSWVLSTGPTTTKSAERSRLSNLATFTDDFFLFAKKFSLKAIQDTSGPMVPNLQDVVPSRKSITLHSGGTIGTVTLTTVPFTITIFQISIDDGQTVSISASAHSHQRLAYRRPTDQAWTMMQNGPTSGPQRVLNVKCNDKGDPQPLLILFVSTANSATDNVGITIKQKTSDPKCKCKKTSKVRRRGLQSCEISQPASGGGFSHWPLFNPATSGGYCPTGTHIGTLAIWCCPTGMELDATVASEMSICCPSSADCSKSIVPNNMRCADPSWVLWSQNFRQIGCCQKGLVPNSMRYCVLGTKPAAGYTTIAQASAPTGATA